MDLKIAWRNLSRHRWRTGLTLGGLAVAVGALIWMNAMMDAFFFTMIDSATGDQMGAVQIHDTRYVDRPLIHFALEADDALVDRLAAPDTVDAVARRIYGFGLLGTEGGSMVALLLGVEPGKEGGASEGLRQGTWLALEAQPDKRQVVLGEGLAQQLGAKVGDELVLIGQAADGSSADDLLTVVGITRSMSSDLNRQAAWMHIDDLAWLLALEGKAHELVVFAPKGTQADLVAADVTAALDGGAEGVTVRTWQQLLPELAAMIGAAGGVTGVLYGILYFLAALGILNSQRMSALERKREFGVMLAIGLTPGRLARVLLVETVLLSVAGGILGAVLGGAVASYHSVAGLDFSGGKNTDEAMSYLGMNIDYLIVFDFHWDMAITPVVVMGFVGLLCGLWPAVVSARLDTVRAISGRT